MVSHLGIVGAMMPLSICYVAQALALQKSVAQGDKRDCPSVFVAVLSSRDNFDRRSEIRSMWTTAGSVYDSDFEYRFAVCTAGGVTPALKAEQDSYGDMIHLDCEEGYLDGLLTRKVAASMEYYLKSFANMELYMKIDDDAYLSSDRLCSFMDMQQKQHGKDVKKSYMGVFAEGHERMNATHPVIRDKTNAWYEPYSKYPYDNYPMSAKGGPGYILPYAAVEEIINTNIAKDFELNNEDKAVGYWVTKLKKAKITHYIDYPGTDGYEEHKEYNYRTNRTRGTFGSYPLIVHHHLEGPAIACLHEVEFTWDPHAIIDACFHLTLFSSIPKEHVRIHMPY